MGEIFKMNKGILIQKNTGEKVLSVISAICSIIIIVLSCMQIFSIWEDAINVVEPLLGIVILIQAIQNWKKNKVVAILNLCVSIFIFLVCIFIFINR